MGSEEYKEYDAKYFLEFQGLNFSADYRDIPVVADISEFDLVDKYGDRLHDYIGLFYWLKAQIHLLKYIIKQNKAMMFVCI